MSNTTAPTGPTGSNEKRLPAALVPFLLGLHELAGVSDAIVELVGTKPEMDTLRALGDRASELQKKVAQASPAAQGYALPTGPEGAALVALLQECNRRIQAGIQAKEGILSYWKTVDHFSNQFVTQAVGNLANIAAWPSLARLANAFQGRPAVIVSAGPSLDKNIEVIRRFKGRALVVAVSHSLLALQRAGIAPDMVVVIDPQDIRYHFDGVAVQDIGTLVLGTSVRPDLFALPVRRFVTFSSNARIDNWVYDGLEEDLPINSGGSVSNVAFSVAARLGCDPIIVVGQDLSFPDGRYYASTTSDGDARVTVTPEGASVVVGASDGYRELEPQGPQSIFLREVPGYYGGTVATSFALRKAWSWFVDEAKRQAGQRTLLNCTEGGAYIEGMEHVPLAEAAERYAREAVPIEPVVDRVVAQIDRERRRRHMLERVTEMRTALSRCMDQARACRVLAERARRRPEYLSKLKAAEERLTRSLESMPFISTMVQPEMRVAMAAGKQASSVEDSLDASMGVYDAVIRVSLALRGPFERACESVRRPSTFVLRSA